MIIKAKREAGDGGAIIYAMIWFTILFAFYLFFYTQFNCNLYIAKAEMEMGVHIVEGSVMTSSQRYYVSNELKDDFERDLNRAHIVTSGIKRETFFGATNIGDPSNPDGTIKESFVSNSTTLTTDETNQCKKIGNQITSDLQHQFYLDSNNEPQGGGIALLSSARFSGTKLVISDYVKIYEPIYEYQVVRTATGNASNPYVFAEAGNIVGWAEYDLYFDENTYNHTEKKILSNTPTLENGRTCEGATIEMSLTTTFYGVNSWFAAASPVTTNHKTVEVTQATDIVHVNLDSRKH